MQSSGCNLLRANIAFMLLLVSWELYEQSFHQSNFPPRPNFSVSYFLFHSPNSTPLEHTHFLVPPGNVAVCTRGSLQCYLWSSTTRRMSPHLCRCSFSWPQTFMLRTPHQTQQTDLACGNMAEFGWPPWGVRLGVDLAFVCGVYNLLCRESWEFFYLVL